MQNALCCGNREPSTAITKPSIGTCLWFDTDAEAAANS